MDRDNHCIFSFRFFHHQMLRKCRGLMFAIVQDWFKNEMKVIDCTKAVTQHFLDNSFKKSKIKNNNEKIQNTQKWFTLKVCFVLSFCVFCAVLRVCFCNGHFVMVPLNLFCLHCLQHFVFEHLFELYEQISQCTMNH